MTHSSSAPSRYNLSLPSVTDARDETALQRAIRHHRRALRALQGISFEGISSDTTQQLRRRLQRELAAMQQRLHHPPSDRSPSARM